ncbi:LamG-like jellyroll fold domain-containing protein [Salisaeta longa]|uniref:LamG-like jellyroll fold domain-containing protein n=1 Tax=Salisaeta longa TaxID=503170 RepID=UPI00146ABCE9|nr:LamG-like jellyroll fold domain-containing protein [Salisaeta longa]
MKTTAEPQMNADAPRPSIGVAKPVLRLSVASTADALYPDEQATLTFTLRNLGEGDATNVTIDLNVQSGLILNSITPGDGTVTDGTWSVSRVDAGEAIDLVVDVTKDGTVPGVMRPAITGADQSLDRLDGAGIAITPLTVDVGSSLLLDDPDDYVVLENESAFDFTGNFSVAFWVYLNDRPSFGGLVTKGDTAWRVQLSEDGTAFTFDTRHSQGLAASTTANASVQSFRWYHIAAVYDRDAGQKRLYVNGVLSGSSAETRAVNQNDNPVWLGSNADFPERTIGGALDNVSIWNRVISLERIRAHAHEYAPSYWDIYSTASAERLRASNDVPPNEGLVAAYRFDHNADADAYDIAVADAGGAQNGTSPGTPTLQTDIPVPVGDESAILTDGQPGSVGGTGASMTVNPISFASNAYVAAYRQGRADGALVDGTAPEEDFSDVSVTRRLNPVWGVWVGPEDAEGEVTLAIDFSNVSGIADPSQAILLGRTAPGEPWLEVSLATLDPDARTFTYTFLRGEDESQGFQFAVAAPNDALPVELTAFTATRDGEGALLEWTTASEQNNAGFEIQRRSGETETWTALGFVEGAGTTQEAQTYRFRVEDLPVGTHRFRLKQTDTDGSAHYSDVVALDVTMAEAYRLVAPHPNPAPDGATLRLSVAQSQQVRIAVYDLLGREVATAFRGTVPAQTERSIRIGDGLPSGSYFIRVTGEQFSATERLTVVQ